MTLREEFRWKKLGFPLTVPTQRFFVSSWPLPGLLYVIYRILAACYCLTWEIYSGISDNKAPLPWQVYLTTWTYTLETIYFIIHAVFAVHFYFISTHRNTVGLVVRMDNEEHLSLFPEVRGDRGSYERIASNPDEDFVGSSSYSSESTPSHPWFVVIVWILFNCVSTAAIMVSLVFWGVLVPFNPELGNLSLANLQLHLFNTVLLLIEHSVTAIPVHLLHFVYPFTYGMIYMVFSVFYWVDDHTHVMYNILDWNKPGPTVGYILGVGFIVIPLLHLLIFAFYRLKLKILKMCFN